MINKDYTYIICGAGAAGLSLALALVQRSVTDPILIIDKEIKNTNDRTWCYWEERVGNYDAILHASWDAMVFRSSNYEKVFDTGDYRYKMIRSKDFYQYARSILDKHGHVTMVCEDIQSVSSRSVITNRAEYHSDWVFSSVSQIHIDRNKHNYIDQHFGGWFISTVDDVFDPKTPVLMDFSIDTGNHCRFGYILPFSATTALIEIAEFSNEVLTMEEYKILLTDYILGNFPGLQYTIVESEYGVIPMNTYPYENQNVDGLTYIGTAGGAAKGSTGYAFGQLQHQVQYLADKIAVGKPPDMYRLDSRYRWFDKIFLNVIINKRIPMKQVFRQMFQYNSSDTIIRFMTEKSNLIEDLRIISSAPKIPFLKAWWSELGR